MTTKRKRKRKTSGPKREAAGRAPATPAEPEPAEGTTLSVPVSGKALAWLGARLREVGRGRTSSGALTLLARREGVRGILWDRRADLGVLAAIEAAGLVDAVDDLPAAGLRVEVSLDSFAKLARAFASEPTVSFDVAGGALTLRGAGGSYRVVPATDDEPTTPPLGASGPTAVLDGRDLGRALGLAARFADDEQHGERVLVEVADGGLSILAGGAHRFVRATATADGEPIETAISSHSARVAERVLKRSTGTATVQVTGRLVILTGDGGLGSLGVICRRDDVASDPADTDGAEQRAAEVAGMRARVRGLFDNVSARPGRFVAQIETKDLRAALDRGRALRHLATPASPLTTVLTSDARGLLVGHVLATPYDEPAADAHHLESVEGWTTGAGAAVAINPKLLGGLLPKSGPVLLDCGEPADPIRVRVVDGGVSLDTIVMPYGPDLCAGWAQRLREVAA
ncbi:MAG TPA: hypothetical protein VIY27_09040 [Myxococcota bacterium]